MKYKIVLVTGSTSTKETLLMQLKEFIPDTYVMESYASEVELPKFIKCDMLIISSELMKIELDQSDCKYECRELVVCERSINFDYIDLIAEIPVNQEVLLVNDEKENVEGLIKDLIELGLNHIRYHSYYPGIIDYRKLEIAITPGESDKVPSCVKKIIDIGSRIIGINTLYNILDKLNLAHKDTSFITRSYMQKIINVSKRVSYINNQLNNLNGYLNNIVKSLANGIMVYDMDGCIKYINDEMKKIFSIENKNPENKNIRNIFEGELLPYFLSNEIYEGKSLVIKDFHIKMSKFKVPNTDNNIITIDINDSGDIKKKFSQELLLKGHFAKYSFENIIGDSELLNETKNIALKLSKTDLTVLIEGESGTGKELFASAIHNNSKRKFGPYLAVNFSALPDDLIESELFGYEEGAFTGARKGGKVGLFELADGGTIFLDEIGDISPKVQTKLLRVLQEKEVLPIGGSSIKTVDVRIIAATNKNLKKMVKEKQFRSDLYYRLKIGYINLPPLRERLQDIDKLVQYFISVEAPSNVTISSKVLNEFKIYKWFGNVRELESTIKYMIAVRNSNILSLSDLPDRKFFEEEMGNRISSECNIDYCLNDELENILVVIENLTKENLIAGRKRIIERLNVLGYALTESQIRTRLNQLEEMGYIKRLEFKKGTTLTEKGRRYIIIKQY